MNNNPLSHYMTQLTTRERNHFTTMKSTLHLLSAAVLGVFTLGVAGKSEAAVTLSGASIVWAADSTTNPSSFADTLGGNGTWNLYVRPAGGSFVNSGDDSATAVSLDLAPGNHDLEIWVHHESWGDNAVVNPGSYLNLFVGDRSEPAISARLSAGNDGTLAPLTTSQVAQVPNVSDGSLVAPAGTLHWESGPESVTLNTMRISVADDTVSAFSAVPTEVHKDTVIAVNLTVVPEPSTGLLALLGASVLAFRRRR